MKKAKKEVVLIAFAPNDGKTIEEWEKHLKAFGLRLEEVMTPESWERRNSPGPALRDPPSSGPIW